MAPKAKRSAKTTSKRTAAPASGPEDVGMFCVSGFVARRSMSAAYLGAFLSLSMQVDGLFGCSGVHPAESEATGLVLTILAWTGCFLAGLAFLAVGPCEQFPVVAFALLWACYAGCIALMPSGPPLLYPLLEDKLLLETGLVFLFVASGGAGMSKGTQSVGRLLAAWALFRFTFAGVTAKFAGECGAWREFRALREAYQVEAFPMFSTWPLQYIPDPVLKLSMASLVYAELGLSPLLLAPWRSLQKVGAMAQFFAVVMNCLLANYGCTMLCEVALIFALLDDAWHKEAWSRPLLLGWGCSVEVNAEEVVEEKKTEKAKQAEESSEWTAVLVLLLGYVAFAAFALTAGESPTAAGPGVVFVMLAGAAVAVHWAVDRIWTIGAAGASDKNIWALGLVLFLVASFQLARDLVVNLEPASGISWEASKALVSTGQMLETTHLSHAFGAGAGQPWVCPEQLGRSDIVLTGLVYVIGQAKYQSLSSRQLPASEPQRKPGNVQPYSPRLDRAFWDLAQISKSELPHQTPTWVLRVVTSIAARRGSAAELSAGPFTDSLRATIYGNFSSAYSRLGKPVEKLRMMRMRNILMKDWHHEKWFNRTENKILAEFAWEELEPVAKQMEATCLPKPWADLPIEEGFLTLLAASFVWTVLLSAISQQ